MVTFDLVETILDGFDLVEVGWGTLARSDLTIVFSGTLVVPATVFGSAFALEVADVLAPGGLHISALRCDAAVGAEASECADDVEGIGGFGAKQKDQYLSRGTVIHEGLRLLAFSVDGAEAGTQKACDSAPR